MDLNLSNISTPSCATTDPSCERTLIWGSGSPPAWRVRLYLEETRLPYHSRLISFQDGDLKEPEMLALNPRGLVPIYIDGDIVMYESLAIITFLEFNDNDLYNCNYGMGSGRKLLPRSSKLMSKALMRMHEVNNASAFVGEVVYYLRRTKPEDINESYLSSKRDGMYAEIALWERYFDSGDSFLAGEEISIADICFFPTLAYIVRLGFEDQLRNKFPRLFRYYKRMCQRDSVKNSWPPHWITELNAAKPLKNL